LFKKKFFSYKIHYNCFGRRIKWEKNLKIIAQHNKEADAGENTFWLGMNAYGDMVCMI
jgi:hypothetical protein